MNKTEFVAAIADKTGVAKKDVEAVVGSLTDVVAEATSKGDAIQLIGFGTFNLKERAERQGRNPKTGEAITIPASRSVGFKPGKKLKEAV